MRTIEMANTKVFELPAAREILVANSLKRSFI